MIHQHYDPRQILWFLRNFWKYTREDLVQAWNQQFGDPDFGKSQYQWLKSRYGMKGEWGAALNAPPYPGARPGGPGTENYEPPDLPAHPPRVTLRTRSSSPVPDLVSEPANLGPVGAVVYNLATERTRTVNRSSQGTSRPKNGSYGFYAAESSASTTPAPTMKAMAAFANAAQSVYASASSSNGIVGNNGSKGSPGIGNYHFPYPLANPFANPVSTAMPVPALATSDLTSGVFGQNTLSCVQPQPQPLSYSSMAPSMPCLTAPLSQQYMQLGNALGSDIAFSLGDVPSVFGQGNSSHITPLMPAFAPTASTPPPYAAMPAGGGWVTENMFAGTAASVDGIDQILGHNAGSRQVGIEISPEDRHKQVGAVRFSPSQQAGQASKRKRKGVSVDVEQPQGKRLFLDPRMRISAAPELVDAEVATRSSSIGTPAAPGKTAAGTGALGEAWFDGVHANCMLNVRHKHYADGGVYFATDKDCMVAMGQLADTMISSPSEAAAATTTTVSPTGPTEDENDDEMLARLLTSADGQMDGQPTECPLALPPVTPDLEFQPQEQMSSSPPRPGQALGHIINEYGSSMAPGGADSLRVCHTPVSTPLRRRQQQSEVAPMTPMTPMTLIGVGVGSNGENSLGSYGFGSLANLDGLNSIDPAKLLIKHCRTASWATLDETATMTLIAGAADAPAAAIDTGAASTQGFLLAMNQTSGSVGQTSGTSSFPSLGSAPAIEPSPAAASAETGADDLIDQLLFGMDATATADQTCGAETGCRNDSSSNDSSSSSSNNNNNNADIAAVADTGGIDFAQ